MRGKWKSLRDTFRKELRKLPVQRSGDAAYGIPGPRSSWRYFESLYFLKDQLTARSSEGNLQRPISNEDEILEEEAEIDEIETSGSISLDSNPTPVEPSPLNNEETSIPTPPSAPRKSFKRKQQSSANDEQNSIGRALLDLEKEKLKLIDSKYSKESDQDISFFNSLLPHIR